MTSDARDLESKCHLQFKKYNITNELFDKKYMREYKKYLEDNYDPIDVTELNNTVCKNMNSDNFPLQCSKNIDNDDNNAIDDNININTNIITDLVYLDDDAKTLFENHTGKQFDIEIRGISGSPLNMYFKADDLSRVLSIKNLSDMLIDNTGIYEYMQDYIYIVLPVPINTSNKNVTK